MDRTLRSDLARARRAVAQWWGGSPGWLTGVVTGAQAAVLGAGMLVALSLGAVASAPTVDGSVDADWAGAARVAIDLWLLAHNLPVEIGGAEVSVAPLGLTAAMAGICVAVARRFCEPTVGAWMFAVATYVAGVVATGAVAVPDSSAPRLAAAGAVALVVAGAGAWWGLRGAHGFDPIPVARSPRWLRHGWRLGAGSVAGVGVVAGAVAVVWAVAGASRTGAAATSLHPDVVGAVVFGLGSAAFVPTIAAWALAWMTGQGFAVGEGTRYAPGEIVAGPLPSLPALGGLPDAAGGALVWAPALVVIVGFAVRIACGRVTLSPSAAVAAYAVATTTWIAVVAGVQWAAAGSLGPGALGATGASPSWVAAFAALLLGLGAAGGEAALWAAGRAQGEGATPTGSGSAPPAPRDPGRVAGRFPL